MIMNLKLAEYKNGKFLRFLELGLDKEFMYGGSHIALNWQSDVLNIDPPYDRMSFSKDETDPLERFNGLFDGRTYGEGKFVLILDTNHTPEDPREDTIWQDDIAIFGTREVKKYELIKQSIAGYHFNCFESNGKRRDGWIHSAVGNIHQSPELFKEL